MIDEDQAAGALATMWNELLFDGSAAVATVLKFTDSAWKIGDICIRDSGGYQPKDSAV